MKHLIKLLVYHPHATIKSIFWALCALVICCLALLVCSLIGQVHAFGWLITITLLILSISFSKNGKVVFQPIPNSVLRSLVGNAIMIFGLINFFWEIYGY